jgi:uncharacterized protein YaaR (DUF327 family)
MKNQIWITIFVLAFCSTACSKSDPAPAAYDCVAASKKATDAGIAFTNNPTTATCNAYKAAVNDFINNASKCSASSADIDALKQALAATVCP